MCPEGALLFSGSGGSAVRQEFHYYCILLILRLEFLPDRDCVWIADVIVILIVMITILLLIIIINIIIITSEYKKPYLTIMYKSSNTD